MRFSRRTGWNTAENELARAHRQRLAAGLPVADLTASNPTRVGLVYPRDLLDPLRSQAALDYDPHPLGALAARQAVCRYYADHGCRVMPEQVLLTTSTSEAYSYLFRLLCDTGSEVLTLQPSYPLFDFLADLEDVRLVPVSLVYDHGWQLDLADLAKQVTERARAIVLVHPNNPTGHFTKPWEAAALAELCREHGLALIVDEVFLDYRHGYGEDSRTVSERDSATPATDRATGKSFAGGLFGLTGFSEAVEVEPLAFVVSGLSKIAGLPQMKSAWMVATGDGWQAAMARLEVIADTFLSVSAPTQAALPVWLQGRSAIQEQIQRRTAGNLAELDRQLALEASNPGRMVRRLLVEAGWYAILRIPALQPDDRTVLELLGQGVWAHPGYFFGMDISGRLVLSLLAPPEEFARGVEVVLGYCARLSARQ